MVHRASGSAIGTLTVPAAILQADPVLQLVIQAAPPNQLTVKEVKKGAGSALHLELLNGLKLTHRNSILRCLCGMGLHNALDNAPHYLLGGHSSPVMAAPHHAMALASLSSWMSVADQLRSSKDGLVETMEQINSHLETRAFLIDSPSVTVADIDVAASMIQQLSETSAVHVDAVKSYPHLHRWMVTIQECMHHNYGVLLSSKSKIPLLFSTEGPQVFFFGNEVGAEIPKLTTAVIKASSVSKCGGDGGGNDHAKAKSGGDGSGQQPRSNKEGKTKGQQQQSKPQQAVPGLAVVDVSVLDIRVGQIVKVWHHPESEKLFCEEIDVGEEQPRKIASGLRPFYQTSDLEKRRVVVLCNLKQRNLVGFPSHGMVLCASNADHTAVECMEPPRDSQIGERVTFDKYPGDPEPENKIAKKKLFEAVAPYLKTNAKGICVWKDAVSQTSAGPIKASNGMPDAQVS